MENGAFKNRIVGHGVKPASQFMANPLNWRQHPPELGGIIGIANLIECVDSHPSKWFFGKYGFVISDAKPLNFVALRGKQMFFDVELAFNKNNHLNY